ncbi:MAG TPA: hypothetical protein VJB92_02290 [Candidatus Paceibacterota bacterium]
MKETADLIVGLIVATIFFGLGVFLFWNSIGIIKPAWRYGYTNLFGTGVVVSSLSLGIMAVGVLVFHLVLSGHQP